MLSAERFVAPGFCLISYKLADSTCWPVGVVCCLQDVKGGFWENVLKWEYLLVTSSGGYTMAVLAN